MKASAFVKRLEALIAAHGDLDVEWDNFMGGGRQAASVQLAYRKIPKSKREWKPKFWTGSDEPEFRGEPVFRVP